MRANIAALPDGTYSRDDFLDNDGVSDAPLRIALDLTIAADRMRLDFSRSAPPCEGPLNIARSTTIACCYVALKHLFPDVPANAGCLAPMERANGSPFATATIPPVEILESLYPVMFTQWALRPDSGGPGRHRGGLGAIYEIEVLADSGADVFLLGERGKYPPFGVNGGGAAARNRFIYETDSGEMTPPLVSKVTDVRIGRGRKVRLETPGGGGFGDPSTREPERVV